MSNLHVGLPEDNGVGPGFMLGTRDSSFNEAQSDVAARQQDLVIQDSRHQHTHRAPTSQPDKRASVSQPYRDIVHPPYDSPT